MKPPSFSSLFLTLKPINRSLFIFSVLLKQAHRTSYWLKWPLSIMRAHMLMVLIISVSTLQTVTI